jgi:alkaline phosphatase isozyme conversion protein
MKRALYILTIFLLLFTSCSKAPDKILTKMDVPAVKQNTPTPAQTESSPNQQNTPAAISSFGQRAREHMEVLSNKIGARWAGTTGETQAAEYIKTEFTKIGYPPQLQTFSFTNEKSGQKLKGTNIIALKKGRSTRQIIVGAHYDSGDEGRGADDNASGIAVMLEAAEQVKDLQTPYSIVFIAFDAEEIDLNGSYEYVDQMSAGAITATVTMINLDSIAVGNDTNIYGSDTDLRTWTLKQAKTRQLNLHDETKFDPNDPDNDFSDHAAFHEAGIPYIYFEASDWSLGEKDGWKQVDLSLGDKGEIWHTAYDTIEYIDKTFPGRLDEHLRLYSTLLTDILSRYQK